MNYSEIDGLKYIMEQKECAQKRGEFPTHIPGHASSYTKIFADIEEYMNKNIHVNVTLGAASAGDGMLNDHGEEHVAMVMERAYMILGENAEKLLGYEIFFLLLSIHFHDVGNILGREGHEEKIDEVFEALGELFPLDHIAQRVIREIAMAHGGSVNGDKDTIACVQESDYIDGINIRMALLAAILRYADEIADDKNRASSFLTRVGAVPKKNQVFHVYSLALEPPVIKGDTLVLMYNIENKYLNNKVSKNDTEVFLYDEILVRLQKCLCELEYCRKYSQGFIKVSCFSVSICVWNQNGHKSIYTDTFRLRLSGYPNISAYNLQTFYINSNIRAKDAIKLIDIIKEEEKDVE